MHVAINQVITVHYNLRDDNNAFLDTTYDANKPLVYLHGRGQMIAGFESAIAKRQSWRQTEFLSYVQRRLRITQCE